MQPYFLTILILVATSAVAGEAANEPKAGDTLKRLEAFVYHCSDGDTCRVRIGEAMWMNVRLAGIDAPEVAHGRKSDGQSFGNEARDALNARVKGKTIQLQQTDLDQYNRPVVELFVGDVNVNRSQIEDGWAEVYRGKAKRLDRKPYEEAEVGAKKAKKGIWSLATYESPGEWRRNKKKQ